MNDFINCINAICIEELHFSSDVFPPIQYIPHLKSQILQDFFFPKYSVAEPKYIIPRVVYKIRRWKSNAWKRELCYGGNDLFNFFVGLRAHIKKPLSI